MASIRPLAHSACRTQAALDARAGLPVHGHDSVTRNWSRFCARSWAQELLARAIGNLRHLFHRSRKWTQFCVRNLAIKLCPDFLLLFKINSCGQFLATKTWPFSGHKNVSIFSLSEHGFWNYVCAPPRSLAQFQGSAAATVSRPKQYKRSGVSCCCRDHHAQGSPTHRSVSAATRARPRPTFVQARALSRALPTDCNSCLHKATSLATLAWQIHSASNQQRCRSAERAH